MKQISARVNSPRIFTTKSVIAENDPPNDLFYQCFSYSCVRVIYDGTRNFQTFQLKAIHKRIRVNYNYIGLNYFESSIFEKPFYFYYHQIDWNLYHALNVWILVKHLKILVDIALIMVSVWRPIKLRALFSKFWQNVI